MTPKTKNPKTSLYVKIIIGTILFVALGLGVLLTFLNPTNYAQQIAQPLETALAKAGGVKKSSSGDNGRGWDNSSPWYNSTFELKGDRTSAVALINKIASDNGYNLVHASPGNKGFLDMVSDSSIADWYFDAQKASTFADLNSGTIRLSFHLTTSSDLQNGVEVDVSAELPTFKNR